MKDGRFETQAEIYQALLDGKKIKCIEWQESYNKFVYLKDGILTNDSGFPDYWAFNLPLMWSIYEEPKPKKKITLYRYTYILGKGCEGGRANKGRIFQSEFTECSFREYYDGYGKLLLTESKEVEYDDV